MGPGRQSTVRPESPNAIALLKTRSNPEALPWNRDLNRFEKSDDRWASAKLNCSENFQLTGKPQLLATALYTFYVCLT